MNRDILSIIKSFNVNREQQVLPLKYEAMSEDPFRFFRGTCHLFYHDLLADYPFTSSPFTWLCGDLHLENFGSYKGGNKLVYFDMNDFDEGIQAPVLYDISRLLVSLQIALTAIEFPKKEKKKLVQQLLQQYRYALIKNKALNIEKETATGLIKKLVNKVAERTKAELLAKRTNNKTVNAKLIVDDRLLKLPKEEKVPLAASFIKWFSHGYHAGYKVSDIGFRIAGTGSIGVKRYIFLLENEINPRQKRMIDVKMAMPSSIPSPAGLQQPAWENEAERIIRVQDMMQHVSPAFTSAFRHQGDWFVARAIQPTADKINLDDTWKQSQLVGQYLSDLALLTASAHLRSSGRHGSATADELKAFAEDNQWEGPLVQWTEQYALQVVKDHALFCKALEAGYFNT
ncbi:DUF2252 domain-containing protein [Paraflavitalea soli]|uniref:DUF2252 domain-containing protein n=1 Tax=Paraflavitalea soli TaxID=2315862 RepID=A0A3B7MTG7_9BACT|nr:DUF2252 family protein [Paraflavitalea soli]AXY76350.1 DUF2252 domain-containing protein [Paraflavitalea soli]